MFVSFICVYFLSYFFPVILFGTTSYKDPFELTVFSLYSIVISIGFFSLLNHVGLPRFPLNVSFISLKPSFSVLIFTLLLVSLLSLIIFLLYGIDLSNLEELRMTLFYRHRIIKLIPISVFSYLLCSCEYIVSRYKLLQVFILLSIFFVLCSLFYYRQLFGIFYLVITVELFLRKRISTRSMLFFCSLGLIIFIGWNLLRSGSVYTGIIGELLKLYSGYLDNLTPFYSVHPCIYDLVSEGAYSGLSSALANMHNMLSFIGSSKQVTSQMEINACLTGSSIDQYKQVGGGITYGLLPEVILITSSFNVFSAGLFIALYSFFMTTISSILSSVPSTRCFSILIFVIYLTSIFDLSVAISRVCLITIVVGMFSLLTRSLRNSAGNF